MISQRLAAGELPELIKLGDELTPNKAGEVIGM